MPSDTTFLLWYPPSFPNICEFKTVEDDQSLTKSVIHWGHSSLRQSQNHTAETWYSVLLLRWLKSTTGGLTNISHLQHGQCFTLDDVYSASTGDQVATCSSFLYDSDILNCSKKKKKKRRGNGCKLQHSRFPMLGKNILL